MCAFVCRGAHVSQWGALVSVVASYGGVCLSVHREAGRARIA